MDQGVKAMVTIGGWTGGRWFSTDLGSAANRTAFVKTVLNFAAKHDLEGIDFEYVFVYSRAPRYADFGI
jgi:chitinase